MVVKLASYKQCGPTPLFISLPKLVARGALSVLDGLGRLLGESHVRHKPLHRVEARLKHRCCLDCVL